MKMNHTGFIIGAYPCAPSFHQQGEKPEMEFWRQLADTPQIRGLEQPCLENIHPYGDEWLLRNTPAEWQIVVTAIMETMRRRGGNGGFGLASADEEQRRACIDYYRHLHKKINKINESHPDKIIALELQGAPQAGNTSVEQASDAFARSIKEITAWEWSCELMLEHCDAMTQTAPRKGFLPLENVLETLTGYDIGLCINWARSAIEGRNTSLPLQHALIAQRAGKLRGLMFSGTTQTGDYGEWQDLHAPFAPFCSESIMTLDHVKELLHVAPPSTLHFSGIKLLEINANADVPHRIEILRNGIYVMETAYQESS
ncbi:DUF4862 family protein [Affinibrenneria salicis]|uniref:DUF4862 family protein n=1 Tax=Affinibrenneria salicis TaxID=2590031 RepID=A0A5J5G3W3_9GAMM|nr:DUF4862 family protein [Affinibrenneria salicis]KAA9000723.1 DUF4862 family protein [Affinibrenneria salicis]